MRDAIEALRILETEPYGVNEADAASHQAFIDEQELNFDLLIDDDLHVARAYDALSDTGTRIKRTVAVVGKNGKLIYWKPGAPPTEEILKAIALAEDEE
ncbi:MAG: redoxin domain-containing protein [Thermomicrobiales bacterium]|nr:redoxin domain-containing protein [Thermomicrobiales bacterium]